MNSLGDNEVTKRKTNKEKKIVFPSTKLGNEEQFLPSMGTYLENHEIRSAIFGEQFIDTKNYRAKVFSLPKGGSQAEKYDTVIATVLKVSRSSIKLIVNYLNGKPIVPSHSAIMHISDASSDYINEIDDYYKGGDIIRATVIDAKSFPLQLECKKNDTGVIYTTCAKCGEIVKKIKRNLLICLECGWKQSRNTAINYGNYSIN